MGKKQNKYFFAGARVAFCCVRFECLKSAKRRKKLTQKPTQTLESGENHRAVALSIDHDTSHLPPPFTAREHTFGCEDEQRSSHHASKVSY